MQRRKFLVGMGSLAAGGAATMGTGAYTSISGERNAEPAVVEDDNAWLQLTPGNLNGKYAKLGTTSNSVPKGELGLELNGQSPGSGNGFNVSALTVLEDVFRIKNASAYTQEIWLNFNLSPGNNNNDSDLSNNVEYEDVDFFTGSYDGGAPPDGDTIVFEANKQAFTSGEEEAVGFVLDTRGLNEGPEFEDFGQIFTKLKVNAERPYK